MNSFLTFTVLLPPLLFVAMSYVIAKKWHYNSYASLCAHGAQNTMALKIFRVSTALLALWYYALWYFYISSILTLPYFIVLIVVATIAIIGIVAAPAVNTNRILMSIHNIASTSIACVMFLLALEIVIYNSLPLLVDIFILLSAFLSVVMFVGYVLFAQLRRYTFALESFGIVAFSIGVFLAVLFVGK